MGPIQSKFVCSTRATVELRSLELLDQQLANSIDPVVNAQKCQLQNSGSAVSNSDMFRFLVLFFYGGIYVDADTLFLKDLSVFHGLSFAFKWGGGGEDNPTAQGFNTAVMGLPVGSPIVRQIIEKVGCNAAAFHPTKVAHALGCVDRDTECIGFAMMPSILFDPIHATLGTEKWRDHESYNGYFSSGDPFFIQPSPFKDPNNFFPGAFTYHWHNRWERSYHEKSEFARLAALNSQCDPPTAGKQDPSPPQVDNSGDYEKETTVMGIFRTGTALVSTTNNARVTENSEYPVLLKTQKKRKIFVDLGGWKGDTLALYAQYFLESQNALNDEKDFNDDDDDDDAFAKEAFVFEVDPRNIQVILDKMQGNYSGDSMSRTGDELLAVVKSYTHLIQGAAWNEDKVLNFQSGTKNRNDGRVTSTEAGMQTLGYDIGPWLIRAVKPKEEDFVLIKIDIEGAEIEALESLDKAGALQYVDHLIIEWHDWILPKVRQAKPQLESTLSEKYGLIYQYATLDDKLQRENHYGERRTWPVNHCDAHYFRKNDTRADFLQ